MNHITSLVSQMLSSRQRCMLMMSMIMMEATLKQNVTSNLIHHDDGNGAELVDPPPNDVTSILELHNHLSQIVDEVDMEDAEEHQSRKGLATIDVSGYGAVHKSTLVSKLNTSPNGDFNMGPHCQGAVWEKSSQSIK